MTALAILPLRRRVSGPTIAAVVLLAVFFGGFGIWAATAPLSAAASASGVISPAGSRQEVQHFEGGIIDELLVEDGDVVAAGESLIVLRQTQAVASFAGLETQQWRLEASRLRIEALQAGAPTLVFPEGIAGRAESDADYAGYLETQQRLFSSEAAARTGESDILDQQSAQLTEAIAGREAEIAGADRQLGLLEAEIASQSDLVAQGLGLRSALAELQREEARVETERAAAEAAIAEARQQIAEIDLRKLQAATESDRERAAELEEVNRQLADLAERLSAAGDVLDRTVIRAPVAGTVVGLAVHTPGGVIQPGETLMAIVPSDQRLVIEARVNPIDIDVVRPGLSAQVHLLPYAQRFAAPLEGVVERVGADTLSDPDTGEVFYSVEISVDREQLANSPDDIELSAGMPAEVYIVTGERTLLQYLLEPLTRSLRGSFREPDA